MTEIAKAYVQIVPTTKDIGSNLKSALGGELGSAGDSAGSSWGSKFGSAAKKAVAALGIGKMIGDALNAGGNLQQSFGGLETIYGDEAAASMKRYAAAAAEAGISANSYAEQAVSFGASLKQAFAGDTVAAAEAANTAILDMADNSAKMGTDIQSIQNAYQGFAKQNYTMLDNLKLGYGGTKSEMERLLADAEKLTGIHYDIENLGDVYSAIHAIQKDLGLTGVAAEEANSTLTGSAGAVKAAWENTLAALTTGGDLQSALASLGTSVHNFLFNNLVPMLGNLISQIPGMLGDLGGMLIKEINTVSEHTDELVSFAVDVVTNLANAIIENAPQLGAAAINLAISLGKSLISYDWAGTITELVNNILGKFSTTATSVFSADQSVISGMISGIGSGVGNLLSTAAGLVTNILQTIIANLPQIFSGGAQLIGQLLLGILQAIPSVLSGIGELVGSIFDVFFTTDWATIGMDIINGIISGLSQLLPNLIEAAKNVARSALETAKGWLGISSPSKRFAELGMYSAEGFAEGLTDNSNLVADAATGISNIAASELSGSYSLGMAAGISAGNVAADVRSGDDDLASTMRQLNRLLSDLRENGIPAFTYLDGKAISNSVSAYQRKAMRAGVTA